MIATWALIATGLGGAAAPAEPAWTRIAVTVGLEKGDFVGRDSRVLQGAVDYVASLGGGTVRIGPGEFAMINSLHLRNGVTVRGEGETTVLIKCPGREEPLVLDGDYGQEEVTLRDATGFEVGMGVSVRDDHSGGFHTVVANIIGKDGNTLKLDEPMGSDYMVRNHARAALAFPVISGYYVEGAEVSDLVVDGNREESPPLNGCRGAGVFLYRAHGTRILRVIARNYPGDGISFQQSNDVLVERCIAAGNANLGIHPGSGSGSPVVRGCRIEKNGDIGLFLCWRVKHGLLEDNVILSNGGAGISIGHKDTDNLFRRNVIRDNRKYGIHFRDETEPMAGHRNRIEENVIERNGGAGIRIDGETHDIEIVRNRHGDARPEGERTQREWVSVGPKASRITVEGNAPAE
ncbi:MAG: right-handed parallel beta-helix repeat-containing protein [Planctomycetes bacterium]|nr:right-handed parallel beta-helix repeat-containing protein [Planctomycetota bacterium]